MLELWIATAALMTSPTPVCHLPFDVVRSEAAARTIAEIVIASAPDGPGEFAPYNLELTYIEQSGTWLAVQSPVPRGGVTFLGGDGLGMRIATCDGSVSDVHRQR